MPRRSPLATVHEAHGRAENERRAQAIRAAGRGEGSGAAVAATRSAVEWIPFGPDGTTEPCRIVANFGTVEAEYASIRRGAAIIDACQRGTLRLRGSQRFEFLQRMLTQDLASIRGGGCIESFWLNRKGRIEADLLVVQTAAGTLIDVDVFAAAAVRESLDRFLFGEDVSIEDATPSIAHLSLHGPLAGAALEGAGLSAAAGLAHGGAAEAPLGSPSSASDSAPGGAELDRCVVARRDQCGVPGFEIFVAVDAVEHLWTRLLAGARPAGWEAYNIARIEAGTPLFRIDFGTDSLPHETGLIASRVSFRKGCYPGQEIVARMQSLGAPKQTVVAFRCSGASLPVAGAQLRRPNEPLATPIGVVTSSTVSPILGGAGIGFATVRSSLATPGLRLAVHTEGEAIEISILGPPASFLGGNAA